MKSSSREAPSEPRLLGTLSASSIRNLLPRSLSNETRTSRTRSKFDSENVAPLDPNIQFNDPPLSPTVSFSKRSPLSKTTKASDKELVRSEVEVREQAGPRPDPHVKVVVRIKPANRLDVGVKKVSDDTVSVGDRTFTFDSVLDSNSTQEDVFQSVGKPLVKNALSGYNASILAYGQSGSGKTYTMWGPPSAMIGGSSRDGLQGIVPRVFQMLFSDIQREQDNCEGKQINYQCRCSFLEIYNEKIGDLLDPTQRNLEIRDDPKNGFYVESLTEEYVTSYDDVTQILIKGLSSRKVGATSINSKSSRSHIVFTCVIESWSKDTSSKCFGSSRTSRITLVDLAGYDRNIPDDAGKEFVKEGKYVKKSTSQLGHLINILAGKQHSAGSEVVPYRNSCLTHLLREPLGGNAKLSVICAISPENKFDGETISTLRFGQRVRLVQNDPIVNEITEDDVNDLSDQIRQLKDELIKAKSNVYHSVGSSYGFSGVRSARESLNLLRHSINRSLILPHIDNEAEEELGMGEDDVKELQLQIESIRSSFGQNSKQISDSADCTQYYNAEGCEDLTSEHYASCSEASENDEIISEEAPIEVLHQAKFSPADDSDGIARVTPIDPGTRSSMSIRAHHQCAGLEDPTLSESPKIRSSPRKSIVLLTNNLSREENVLANSKDLTGILGKSQKQSDHVRSSLRSSKMFSGPTETLAASLHRGLEIIDYHQRCSASNKSLASFSFEHLAIKPCQSIDKADASVQTIPEKRSSINGLSASFQCPKCQQNSFTDVREDVVELNNREKQLESLCKEQEATIEQLNQLLEKYKLEKEEKDKNFVTYDYEENNFNSVSNDTKLLRWKNGDNHVTEFMEEKCDIKEVQEQVDHKSSDKFPEMDERRALLDETESLKSKLQSVPDSAKSTERLRSSLLSQSIQWRKTIAGASSEEELERERQRWMEMESDWISLTDELRIDIESNRQRAEKVEMELRLEKQCTEELDDALKRAVVGHARMVEHYADLQEKYNELAEKHRLIMGGIADIKKAAAKAGAKGRGTRFAKSLAAELSAVRVEREKERELLKKENRSLRIQLRDTAEAVHAAGELLVRLREAEEATSIAEENVTKTQEENEKLKKQIEKLKRKHKMEMITMKQYLAESRLPEAALRPLYREDSDVTVQNGPSPFVDDDQAWRAEFGAIYQEHY